MTERPASVSADLALVCDPDGVVLKVLRNTLEVDASGWVGTPFAGLVDAGSRMKAERMLEETRREGAVFGWELAVAVGGTLAPVHFAAGETDRVVLVVGASSPSEVEDFYREMMRLANEQANELRALLKERRVREDSAGADSYEEMTRLNNELAKAQREMAQKNAELGRLNDQKNQFLGMAAHDLRNPLSVIQGYSEILLDNLSDDLSEAHREMLEVVHSSSEFMVRMVDDLLDVSRIESGRLHLDRTPTDLAALLEHNVQLNRILAERKDIEIELEVADDLPLLALDAGKIDQVLNNLLGNAAKYSHEGTRIRVRCALEGGRVALEVEDQGQGIPEDEREELFKPFATTSVSATGGEESTGLGLMIVRRIVEGHDGEISVRSRVGEGSTFTVYLPAEPVAETRAEAPRAADGEGGGGTASGPLSILLADDSRVVRTLVAGMLEGQGHSVTAVADGEDVLARLEDEPWDVVLLDLEMPGKGGLETARAMREAGRSLPVVALTGHREDEVANRLDEAGFAAWVGKPVDADALAEALARAVGRSG